MVRDKKVIVILGPTSTGKSGLAVEVAKKIQGEIISADSRQVYTGLNIGTGKITKSEMKGVPHYLLDVASPRNKFSVVKYKILAEKKIKEIINRKKIPIICGGTGFYINAVTEGMIFPEVPVNNLLRKKISKLETKDLYKILYKLDRKRARNIDKYNKVRLIRAIEIAKFLGKVPHIKYIKPPYEFIKIGLFLSKEKLQKKIYNRLIRRLNNGMINEIKRLHKNGLSWKRMEELGLEYRYISEYLQKKINKNEMIEKLNIEINKYAKRQITWFKKDKDIVWLDALSKSNISKVISLLRKD